MRRGLAIAATIAAALLPLLVAVPSGARTSHLGTTSRSAAISSAMTDDRAAFSDEGPQEFDLYPAGPADGADPAGSAGDAFVCRLYDHQPWTPAIFGRLSDETPYVYLGGRITPRVA